MKNTQELLLCSKKILYQIFGFQTLIFDGTFKKTTSISPFYYAFVAFLFIVADAIYIVQTDFKYNKKHTITYQVTAVASILVSASCVVLPIISESFINIKERMQVQNRFLEIHKMLSTKPFVESDYLVLTRKHLIFFVIINAVQGTYTMFLWRRLCYGTYFAVRSLVIAMNILETLTEIYICKHYAALLNDSFMSHYSRNIKDQDTIDFQETQLIPKIATDNEISDEKKLDIIDYTKIYYMLIDNMKLIALRFTYTVNYFILFLSLITIITFFVNIILCFSIYQL